MLAPGIAITSENSKALYTIFHRVGTQKGFESRSFRGSEHAITTLYRIIKIGVHTTVYNTCKEKGNALRSSEISTEPAQV